MTTSKLTRTFKLELALIAKGKLRWSLELNPAPVLLDLNVEVKLTVKPMLAFQLGQN